MQVSQTQIQNVQEIQHLESTWKVKLQQQKQDDDAQAARCGRCKLQPGLKALPLPQFSNFDCLKKG